MAEKTPSHLTCPNCGFKVEKFKNPVPTVDIIIEIEGRGVVLIKEGNPTRSLTAREILYSLPF